MHKTPIPTMFFLEAMQVLSVKPGDVVVLRFQGRLSPTAHEYITEDWKKSWKGPGERPLLMILEEGAEIGVLRRED